MQALPFHQAWPLTGDAAPSLSAESFLQQAAYSLPCFALVGHTFSLQVSPQGGTEGGAEPKAGAGGVLSLGLQWHAHAAPGLPPPPLVSCCVVLYTSKSAADGKGGAQPIAEKRATVSFTAAQPIASWDAFCEHALIKANWPEPEPAPAPATSPAAPAPAQPQLHLALSVTAAQPPLASLGPEDPLERLVLLEPAPSAVHASGSYDSPLYSDCRLLLDDGTSLHGHRLVLSQGSRLLAGRWAKSSSAREAAEAAADCTVRIEAEPAVATALVRHLYGLPVSATFRQLPDLLLLADAYGAQTLVAAAAEWAGSHAMQRMHVVALAALIPAVRAASSLQGHALETRLLRQAMASPAELSATPLFLQLWSWADVTALSEACTTAAARADALKVSHMWVQYDVTNRRQYMEELLERLGPVKGAALRGKKGGGQSAAGGERAGREDGSSAQPLLSGKLASGRKVRGCLWCGLFWPWPSASVGLAQS